MSAFEYNSDDHGFGDAPKAKPNWVVIGALVFCLGFWMAVGAHII